MDVTGAATSTIGLAGRSVPAPGGAAKAAVSSGAASSPVDTVSLSPLASSLHDESLTVFNALSDEQRGQLSSLVESGRMSGEEVHDALKQRLKEARRSAYSSIRRMFANDNAELAVSEGRSLNDLKQGLGATLDRRSALMGSLTELERNGGAGSQAYRDLSDQLLARGMNPMLSSGRANPISLAVFEFNPQESRLMSTRKEGDAVYALKATGFNLDDLDRRLRPIGEKDATSIILEGTGLPRSSTVAADREFSIDDAIIRPMVANPVGVGGSGALPNIFGRDADRGTLIPTGTPGLYEVQGLQTVSNTARKEMEEIRKNLKPLDPVEEERRRSYQRGLFARY